VELLYLGIIAGTVAGISVAVEMAARLFRPYWLKSVAVAVAGLSATVPLYRLVTFAASQTNALAPRFGGSWGSVMGALLGAAAITLSAACYRLRFHVPLVGERFWERFGWRFLSNSSPAFVEEVGLRGGIVHLLTAYHGAGTGLLCGSATFGLLHLVGRLVGRKVGLRTVAATAVAGLFLGLVFLRFGLGAAIAAHWAWNVLVGSASRAFDAPAEGPLSLESTATTLWVLIGLCAALVGLGRPLAGH
jgi:membrane protease YdiL (CAAX protease family)